MLAEARPSIPVEPGRPRRVDYEYRREGTRNLFMACEPLAGWRHVVVTERRTAADFAHQMRWLVDEAYPDVPVVRLVLDQSEHPSNGVAVPGISGGGGPAHRQAAGVSPHTQARQLAEYGGDRVQRPLPQLSQAAPPGRGSPLPGSPTPWNWSEMRLKPASTGVSASKTPELNSIACIPSIPNLIEY